MSLIRNCIKPPEVRGVGVVYAADGWPRVSAEWVRGLDSVQRKALDAELERRGFRMNSDFNLEEIY